MSTLPTSPFPELRPLEVSPQMPSLSALLSSPASLPIRTVLAETKVTAANPPPGRPPLQVSRFPKPQEHSLPRHLAPGVLADMPVAPMDAPPLPPAIAEFMAAAPQAAPRTESKRILAFPVPIPCPEPPTATSNPQRPATSDPQRPATSDQNLAAGPSSPLPMPGRPTPEPGKSSPLTPVPQAPPADPPDRSDRPATDEDLRDALLPILEATLSKALYAPETGLHTYLEPMLRSTVRRAIAEQLATSHQFRSIGALDRLAWRLSALFTSRSYDEIVFDRTRRYQVEEVYLLRKESRSLISYASHDPVRHASPRRIESTLKSLVSKLLDDDGNLQTTFDLPERRIALVRQGSRSLLVAVLRGSSNALVRADLDYVQRQAEERFGSRLDEETDAFIHVLQPILEGCLLIQSPAPPR